MSRPAYEKTITAAAADVDELGHVNNAVWVRWIQDMATEHWRAAADPEHVDRYVWVVVRHEIDYLRAVLPGETVTGRTWVGEAPRGARFDRLVEFLGEDGKPRVRARTTWAILDKATGRPLRVPGEVAAPFLQSSPGFPGEGDQAKPGGGALRAP
ncbi:MAG TPA: acyl-CoA thioesterase [Allosphingosinicella sp.]|jgi:acyl-CoA thioester hydrolase